MKTEPTNDDDIGTVEGFVTNSKVNLALPEGTDEWVSTLALIIVPVTGDVNHILFTAV